MPHVASTVLFVDDEPQACKWFTRSFSDEFTILTAPDAAAALALLRERGDDIAVLVTDQRMPGGTGIELLAAAQGCDFHDGLTSSAALESVRRLLRSTVPTLTDDRHFHPDIEAANQLVRSGAIVAAADIRLPELGE